MQRRNFLLLGGVGLRRLYASSSDFWNKKDPADWTGAEKDQLTNNRRGPRKLRFRTHRMAWGAPSECRTQGRAAREDRLGNRTRASSDGKARCRFGMR